LSKSLYSSRNSSLVIRPISCSTTGPYIPLNIFLTHVFSLLISISVTGQVSLPHTATGFTTLQYTLILNCFTHSSRPKYLSTVTETTITCRNP
jgi:hypothetical protein